MKIFIYWITRISVLSFILMGLVIEAKAETWDTYNDPSRFDLAHRYSYQTSALPLQATLATIPWSETYWPSFKGSINVRWNTPDQDGFKYIPYTQAQVKTLTLDQLKKLSPSEKYDLYMGHYDYPLWNEVKQYADPNAGEWTGLCDGWSMAAIQYAEPKAVTLANPEGILIPFGSSDVKALMTYAAEFHFMHKTVEIGRPCLTNHPTTPDEIAACDDINAGAMHVVLANQIGIQKTAFVTERQPNADIWNQPTYGYETQFLASAPSNVPGAHGVQVHTVLHYAEDLDESYWDPITGTPNFHSNKIVMDYTLDLDANENIVGGTWSKGSDRPDYFWLPTNHLEFTDGLSGIQSIYQAI